MPTPPTSTWSRASPTATPRRSSSHLPVRGESEVRMGLYRDRERSPSRPKSGHARNTRSGRSSCCPRPENIFLVYKEGWHNPESRTTTRPRGDLDQEGCPRLVQEPKKDVIIYLEADTNSKAFDAPPVLTIAVAARSGWSCRSRAPRSSQEDPGQGRRPRQRRVVTCGCR